MKARKEEAVGEKPGPRSDHRAGNGNRRRAHRSEKTSPRTARLIASGVPRMAQKLAEEATEIVIEAVRGKRAAVVMESVDLLYNLAVLWSELGISASEVWAEWIAARRCSGWRRNCQAGGLFVSRWAIGPEVPNARSAPFIRPNQPFRVGDFRRRRGPISNQAHAEVLNITGESLARISHRVLT